MVLAIIEDRRQAGDVVIDGRRLGLLLHEEAFEGRMAADGLVGDADDSFARAGASRSWGSSEKTLGG
jgi:hypothetical protein